MPTSRLLAKPPTAAPGVDMTLKLRPEIVIVDIGMREPIWHRRHPPAFGHLILRIRVIAALRAHNDRRYVAAMFEAVTRDGVCPQKKPPATR